MKTIPKLVSLTCLLVLTGCATTEYIEIDRTVPPYFQPTNVYHDPQAGDSRPKRVLVLPCHGNAGTPLILKDLNEILMQELTKANFFEAIPLSTKIAMNRRRDQDYDLVSALGWAKDAGADGILICRVTSCQASKPLVLGVSMKLWSIPREANVWSVDETLDSQLTPVANGARNYYLTNLRANYPSRRSENILDSPRMFFQYAFAELFSTLPKQKAEQIPQ
ncbi:MAG: hypothetical protein PHV34_16270 [Verrucomicrobiae bacterium]|nr:hypothetical protein [Verrucomicrobiae bacterium]